MAELTQHQVENRFNIAASNPVTVNIPALPGLFFRPLTLGEKGKSSAIYSKVVIGYQAEGMPSEHALPTLLKRAVEASGLSLTVLRRKADIYEKQMKAVPERLIGPYDQLTEEEVAELPVEEQEARAQAIDARGREAVKYLTEALTDDEREALSQIHQIEQIELSLRKQTAEFAARRDQTVAEILMGAIREDGRPYFASMADLESVHPDEALVNLIMAWQQFREGLPSDFFSRS